MPNVRSLKLSADYYLAKTIASLSQTILKIAHEMTGKCGAFEACVVALPIKFASLSLSSQLPGLNLVAEPAG